MSLMDALLLDSTTWGNGHGITVGDVVNISRASISWYNGNFVVIAADQFTFQYALARDPQGSSVSGHFGRLWGGGRIVNENNVLALLPTQTDWFQSRAVQLGVVSATVDLFPLAVLRRNVIRHADGVGVNFGQSYPYVSSALIAFSCGGLIAEENIIDIKDLPPFGSTLVPPQSSLQTSPRPETSSRATPVLTTTTRVSELSTNIEDAVLLAF